MIAGTTDSALCQRIAAANRAYGPFTSTHEAMGVCMEEWDEFRLAVHSNDISAVQHEALDLAAALIRLHDQLMVGTSPLRSRSMKAKT